MDAHAHALFADFASMTMPNLSNITRCRIIDDWLGDALASAANTQVVTVGAGFDSRPFRLRGGHWLEIDEPAIIERKNDRLPADECANPLERIPIAFGQVSLADKLSAAANRRPVIVVIGGVLMYLDEDAIAATLQDLGRVFAEHRLLCDLMDRAFFERFGHKVHDKLMGIGATFSKRPTGPQRPFRAMGYRRLVSVSIFQRSIDLGAMKAIAHVPDAATRVMRLLRPAVNGHVACRWSSA